MQLSPISFVLTLGLLAVFAGCGGGAGQSTNQTAGNKALAVANAYYAGFHGELAVADLPLAQDVHFHSPIAELEGAAAFRKALAQLLPRVRSLVIRRQLAESGVVISVYDLDLGAPGGPIPMAETLRVANDRIVDVELLFDPARLQPPADR